MTSPPTQSPPEVADPRAKELPQYSLRQILAGEIPNGILTGLLYSFPAYRYRSTWMSIILHSAQSVYFTYMVLGVVLGLA
jgi:hypothetical protein